MLMESILSSLITEISLPDAVTVFLEAQLLTLPSSMRLIMLMLGLNGTWSTLTCLSWDQPLFSLIMEHT